LPNHTTEIALAAIKRESYPWTITPADFPSDSDQVKALYARLIGAKTREIAIISSTAQAA